MFSSPSKFRQKNKHNLGKKNKKQTNKEISCDGYKMENVKEAAHKKV